MDVLSGRVAGSSFFRRTLAFLWPYKKQFGSVALLGIYCTIVFYILRRASWDLLGKGTRTHTVAQQGGNGTTATRTLELTKEETTLCSGIVHPDDIKGDFSAVYGLKEAKDMLLDSVILPFRHPDLYAEHGSGNIKGVLLYGPPGTGKTMLARALAKEVRGSFVSVSLETVYSRFVGDSEKLAAAVFSLGRKLSPCVVFIDEIDSLLSPREDGGGGVGSQVQNNVKSIFMAKWDGLTQDPRPFIILGATNRQWLLDDAIKRRMPVQISIPLPPLDARDAILRNLLGGEGGVPSGVRGAPPIQFSQLAEVTNGYSGSELREVVEVAQRLQMREVVRLREEGDPTAAPAPITAKQLLVGFENVHTLRGKPEMRLLLSPSSLD